MKMIVYSNRQADNYNAGPKAPRDIEAILEKEGALILPYPEIDHKSLAGKITNYVMKDRFLFENRKNTDICLIQMPFSISPYFKHFVRKHTCILLIHDLVGLRNRDSIRDKKEISIYKQAKYIITHNKNMTSYLVEAGVDRSKIYELQLFDYLCGSTKTTRKTTVKNKINSLAYVGNISKAPFLRDINSKTIKYNIYLYGNIEGHENILNERIIYKGAIKSDELPNKIIGDIGLIWDGNFDNSDESSPLKKYTTYNTPHKLSCYIAAGMPVIAWDKSAIKNFIIENNIGYLIDNLSDIEKIKFDDYEEKKNSVLKLSKKVRNGYYTKEVIKKILDSRDSRK